MKKIVFILVLLGAWYHFYHIGSAPSVGSGSVVESPPYQSAPQSGEIRLDDFVLTPRVEFEVQARVLAASRYYFDRKGRLAPMAIVVGWGSMSDESIYRQVTFRQKNHGYQWQTSNPEQISDDEILTSTAHIHLIPANAQVKKAIYQIRLGDVVTLQGTLVNVRRTTGWKWPTSTTRDDLGENAGEILYLKTLQIHSPEAP